MFDLTKYSRELLEKPGIFLLNNGVFQATFGKGGIQSIRLKRDVFFLL